MYRDIATMDQGPGYLNGILSLILNTTASGERIFSEEEQRAIPYFHRSRAAELLALLDTKFPNSTPAVPELHARLLEFYASSGESEAVIRGRTANSSRAFPKLRSAPRSPCSWPTPTRAPEQDPGRIRHLRFRACRNLLPKPAKCLWVRGSPARRICSGQARTRPGKWRGAVDECFRGFGCRWSKHAAARSISRRLSGQPAPVSRRLSPDGPRLPNTRECWSVIWPGWCN